MRLAALVRRGLWHHRRRHLGVFLGSAVAAAVLVGALAVGDSVRASLRAQALERVGRVDAALDSGERLFRSALADELAAAVPDARLAPALVLGGVASVPDGARRANEVQVFGVDGRFFELGGSAAEPYGGPRPAARAVLLSERLAEQLALSAGDTLIARVEPPSAVPRDMVLAASDDLSLALRLTVAGVLPDEHLGRLALTAGALPPFSVFVDLAWLQTQVEAAGRANLILAGGTGAAADTTARLEAALRERWTLEDGELELGPAGPGQGELELRTRRVFLDPPVTAAAALAGGTRILTYFVNELRVGQAASPYSMVTAVDPAPGSGLAALLPADLADDEVVLNDWLAQALGAAPGDALALRYYALGPNRRLVEETASFRVRAVVPLAGAAADPDLMPAFPGLHDAEHCRDWEAGVPIDLDAVGDADEAYWDAHRGTPKAFLTLAAGERLWSNRFGALTAVRLPLADSPSDGGALGDLRARLEAELDPAAFGLTFRDVRTPALAASAPATDFGGLFLGLSCFLLGAALLLTALLFAFGVESRAGEIGALASVGFRPALIRRLFLLEGGAVALLGGLLGVGLGLIYTRAVLAGLATVWRGAVGGAPLSFHAGPASLVGGALASFACALAAMSLALRGQARLPVAELVRSAGGLGSRPWSAASGLRRARAAPALAVLATLAGLALAFGAPPGPGSTGAFFGAGTLVLLGGLAAARAVLARRAGRVSPGLASVRALAATNGARRPGRSLATVALLASGSFLVLSVGVHHRGAEARPQERGSGTGGFALFARSSLPVLFDLNGAEGRQAFGLAERDLEGVSVLALRVRDGDDASCLQLGVPAQPELLAVDPAQLHARGAFTFAGTWRDTDAPWLLLQSPADGAVPAVADHASATWTMKKRLGETFDYVDERGEPFQIRLVGTLEGSLLQGDLIIAERDFEARFPSAGGYRAFLIDAPAERAEQVAATLGAALSDVGLELTPAARRLAEFNAVQNTYLVVFQLLGGLGLLLGSAGLGLVVLRNALERRAELAALRAVGFTRGAVRRLLFSEHLELFAAGLGLGVLAAAVAWVPVAAGGSSGVPASVPVLLALLALSGFVWVRLAAGAAVRGSLIDALRDE